jgi:hypothetical protein
MIAYIMCMDGIFDLPESRVRGLLRDAWKDSAEGGDRILEFRNLRDEWEWEDHFRRFATEHTGQTSWNLDSINTQLFTLINQGAVYRNNPEKDMVGIAMKGTERGYLPAICTVAGLYEAGQGGIKKDPTKAAELWDRARAKAETDVPSQYVLGRCMQMSPLRMREGTEWLKKAVAQGYPQAQCLLGQCFSLGSHGTEADLPAAFDLLEKAADRGHAGAAFLLGTIFLKRGDVENARDWFERASDPSMMLGHPFAFMESRAQKIIDGIDYEGMSCEYLVDKYLSDSQGPRTRTPSRSRTPHHGDPGRRRVLEEGEKEEEEKEKEGARVNADDAETPGTETGETRRDATRLCCFCEQTNLFSSYVTHFWHLR